MRSRQLFIICACLGLAIACSSAPKAPDEVFETRNQATNYVKLADGLVAKGQYESALTYYRQAIDVFSSVDSIEGASLARSSLGRLWLAWGDLPSAETEFIRAADYASLSKSGRAIALAATGIGEVAFRRGDAKAALAAFERALAAAPADDSAIAIALHDRASAEYSLGLAIEAKVDLDKAVAVNLKLKRWSELASNRYLLASFLTKEGDIEGAIKAAIEALLNDKKSENSAGVTSDLLLLSDLLSRSGKYVDSYWYYRRSFDAALGANQAKLARKALEGLIATAPKADRESEVDTWKASLATVESISATR